jgi:hypothetical protein
MCLSAQFASFMAVSLTGCVLCAKTNRLRDRLPACLSLCCTHTHTHSLTHSLTQWHTHARTHSCIDARTRTHTRTSSGLRKLAARLKLSLAASMKRRSTMLRCTLALIAVCRKLYPVQRMKAVPCTDNVYSRTLSKQVCSSILRRRQDDQISVFSPFSPKSAA